MIGNMILSLSLSMGQASGWSIFGYHNHTFIMQCASSLITDSEKQHRLFLSEIKYFLQD